MSQFQKKLFDKIQQNTNVNPEDVYNIADSVKHANFSDEQTVRHLVRHLARVANKRIPKDKEDKIVASITQNKMPADMETLNRFFKN